MAEFTNILTAWNEADAEGRRAIVDATVSDPFFYDDPHRTEPVISKAAFLDFLQFFRDNVSGVTIALDGDPDVVRSNARFGFALTRADGEVFSKGTYFVELDGDARISKMIGFLD